VLSLERTSSTSIVAVMVKVKRSNETRAVLKRMRVFETDESEGGEELIKRKGELYYSEGRAIG
jgi:hypothetical protein